LPSADGTSGQQLTTNGAGVLSWASASGTTTVSNTSSTNTLTTTINGVTGTGVNIINSNALSLSGVNLTSTVNGVASTAVDLSSATWSLSGNTGTTVGTNFIGTTDAQGLAIKTNNTERMRIQSGGNVGIGTTSPSTKLDVNGTFKLGASGSALTGIIKASVTSGAISVPAAGSISTTFTVTGAATGGSTVIVSPRAALSDGIAIAYAYVSAANTVTVNFISSTSLGASISSGTAFDITVIQF